MISSTLRRSLLQIPTRPLVRTLVTTPLPTNDAPPIFKDEHDITDPVMKWLEQDKPNLYTKPEFKIQPVYIQLSSLLREEAVDSQSQVAVLSPSVFRHPIRRDILHLCVVHHLDGLRQGTAANKSRGEVSGSGAKLRAQKGSGRARLGDRGSPMLRGGGRAFAKKARDFSTKLPRKVIQMGMRVVLSAKVKENSLGVVKSLQWPGVKTSDFARRISELGWNKTLFVTGLEQVPKTLERSSRNVQGVDTMTVSELTVYDAIKWERLVLDASAVEFYEQTLRKPQLDSLAEDVLQE